MNTEYRIYLGTFALCFTWAHMPYIRIQSGFFNVFLFRSKDTPKHHRKKHWLCVADIVQGPGPSAQKGWDDSDQEISLSLKYPWCL